MVVNGSLTLCDLFCNGFLLPKARYGLVFIINRIQFLLCLDIYCKCTVLSGFYLKL